LRDRRSGETRRVSVGSGGRQAADDSYSPSISGDGRRVAFESLAANLVAGDTNLKKDIFVHEPEQGTTSRASLSWLSEEANEASSQPAFSADGRLLAFTSLASNLVPVDTNARADVFVRVLDEEATVRASVATGGQQANQASDQPSLSGDGRFVVFRSSAANLVEGDTNNQPDIFLRDLITASTKRISVASNGTQANGASANPKISADGRWVAFESLASNLDPLSDTNGVSDVFVHFLDTGATRRVSLTSAWAQGNGASHEPSISADGRYVLFRSAASDLVPDDTNGQDDIFLRDRETFKTRRLSVSAAGAQANDESYSPALGADGRTLAFVSWAGNLLPDGVTGGHVYAVDLPNWVSRPAGWNLVAGGPGSNTAGATLFYFSAGSYRSTTAALMVAGSGYWVRLPAPSELALTTVAAPLTVRLGPGWNLIGNATGSEVTLAAGKTAFAFEGGRYLSRNRLSPGEGAWIRASAYEDLTLDK
jgi:Tol biopolymer transport system component